MISKESSIKPDRQKNFWQLYVFVIDYPPVRVSNQMELDVILQPILILWMMSYTPKSCFWRAFIWYKIQRWYHLLVNLYPHGKSILGNPV
jgi:hypothetical protein